MEAPIGLLEPKAAEELLEWQEKRRSIAAQKDNVHHMYRKAEWESKNIFNVSTSRRFRLSTLKKHSG